MKNFKYLAILMVLLLMLSGCTNSEVTDMDSDVNNNEEMSDNVSGGSLVIATKLEPSNFVYNYIWDGSITYINSNIFSKLINLDIATGELYGDLAETWDISDDLQTYTFNLRENVKWHDGEEFTSADVKWTIDSILEHGDSAQAYNYLFPIDEVVTPDDFTVVLKLKEPMGTMLYNISNYHGFNILPKHLYDGTDVSENPYNFKPIGTGPFVFDEHEIGSHCTLKAYKDYHGDGPYLDEVIFTFVPSETTAMTSIEAGEAGWMSASPAFAEIKRLQETDGVTIEMQPTSVTQWTQFNMDPEREYMSDPIVREAIVNALDNNEINEKLYMGLAKPATSWYTTAAQDWADNKDVRIPEKDIDYANKLLDDAGYERGPDGNRFTLTYRAFATSIFGTTDIPSFVKQQLDAIGIEVKIEQFEWALRTEMLINNRDWDLSSQGGDRGPDASNFAPSFIKGSPQNLMNYENEELENVFNQGLKEVDPDKRAEYYHKAQEILAKDMPMYNYIEYAYPRLFSSDYEGFFWQDGYGYSSDHMVNTVRLKNK